MRTEQPQRDRRARGLTSLGHQPLAVNARSFAQFDLWISLDLEKLVDRWAHAAAPNASMPARMAKHHEV